MGQTPNDTQYNIWCATGHGDQEVIGNSAPTVRVYQTCRRNISTSSPANSWSKMQPLYIQKW